MHKIRYLINKLPVNICRLQQRTTTATVKFDMHVQGQRRMSKQSKHVKSKIKNFVATELG